MALFTIKTFYSIEKYICENIGLFLDSVGFCDAFEVISEEEPTGAQLTAYKEALGAGCDPLRASAYALGCLSLDEAIAETLS